VLKFQEAPSGAARAISFSEATFSSWSSPGTLTAGREERWGASLLGERSAVFVCGLATFPANTVIPPRLPLYCNLTALTDLSGTWIDRVHARKSQTAIVLDMDSSVSETHGAQQGSAYNGHFGCNPEVYECLEVEG
jgi:hypothetical protein